MDKWILFFVSIVCLSGCTNHELKSCYGNKDSSDEPNNFIIELDLDNEKFRLTISSISQNKKVSGFFKKQKNVVELFPDLGVLIAPSNNDTRDSILLQLVEDKEKMGSTNLIIGAYLSTADSIIRTNSFNFDEGAFILPNDWLGKSIIVEVAGYYPYKFVIPRKGLWKLELQRKITDELLKWKISKNQINSKNLSLKVCSP